MGKEPPEKARCAKPCRNFARPGTVWCANHDPALAERRKAAGKVRRSKFVTATTVAGVTFDRSTIPTVAKIVDSLLFVAEGVGAGLIEAKDAQAMTGAYKAAADLLWKEKEAVLEAERERAKNAASNGFPLEGGAEDLSLDGVPSAAH